MILPLPYFTWDIRSSPLFSGATVSVNFFTGRYGVRNSPAFRKKVSLPNPYFTRLFAYLIRSGCSVTPVASAMKRRSGSR